MRQKKYIQNIIMAIFTISVFFVLMILLYKNYVIPISEISVIDNIIVGSSNENYEMNTVDKNSIFIKKPDDKKYSLFGEKIRKIILFLNMDNNSNVHFFNNKINFKNELNLITKISNKTIVQINYDNNSLTISSLDRQLSIDDDLFEEKKKELFEISNLERNKIIQLGENFYDLGIFQTLEVSLANLDKKIDIYKVSSENMFNGENYSFEDGLWQDKVGDCSRDMDGKPEVGMENYEDEGNWMLKLSSKNHYACTNNIFSIKFGENKIYKLSFDYKNIAGEDVRYYYKFRNSDSDISWHGFLETIQVSDSEWHNHSIIVDPNKLIESLIQPEINKINTSTGFSVTEMGSKQTDEYKALIQNVDLIDIFFYAPSDGSKEVVNLYDNVKFEEYEFVEERKINLYSMIGENIILAENILLQDGENSFKYITNDENLFDTDSASFEDGMWKKEADDCSKNKSGDAQIELLESAEASHGEKSIELSSRNHYACINKTFPVQLSNGKTYKLQFDYKNIKGGDVMYYYNLRSKDDNESYSEMIEMDDNEWHTHEIIIDPKINDIKNIDIFFYAPSDGSKEIINLYDNVRLTEWLPKDIDSYYLYAEQEVDETPKLGAVEYKSVNRWKNQVVLHGVKDSFLFAYPERYSEKWKAYPLELKKKNANLEIPKRYTVPEIESNRQATQDEVQQMIDENLVSVVGKEFISKNFNGSIRNDNLDDGWLGETFRKSFIPEETHYQINNYGNAWWIDVDKICKEDGKCVQNDDGTYDIKLVIENKNHKYAGLMLWILGIGSVVLIGYLGYDLMRRRRRGKSKRSNVLNSYFHGNENGGMRVDSRSKSRMTRWRSDNGDVRQSRRKNLPRRRM